MSQTIKYSRGAHRHDNTPAQCEAEDFAQFCDAVLADQAKTKGLQWIAGPCAIAPDDDKHRSSESMAAAIGKPHRCGDCVEPRRWVGFDVDRIADEEAFSALRALLHRCSGIVWTTHSHTPEAPRFRIVLELDVPADRAQVIAASQVVRRRLDAQLAAAGYAGIGWDAACDRPEQPLYLPPLSAETYLLEGEPLSLGELLAEAAQPEPLQRAEPRVCAEGDRYAVAALEAAAQSVAATAPGDRNKMLNREAYSLGGFVGAGRLSRESVAAALDAATEGWANLAKTRGTIRGALASGMAKPRFDGLPAPTEGPTLRRVALDEVMAKEPQDWPHVMRPYFPRRVATLLAGHGGLGKSMLALTFAAHVAAGRPWGPFEIQQGRAVFLSFEDEGAVVETRLRRIIDHYSLPAGLVIGHLTVLDGSEAEAEMAIEAPGGLEFTAMAGEVERAVAGADFVVIDNASDTFGANENERRQVRRFIRRLSGIARTNGAAVVLLAHVDKDAAKRGGKGNNFSGSTAWHNSTRSRLALVEADGIVELLHEKANYGPRNEPLTLGRGEWGVLEPVSRAVAEHCRAESVAATAAEDARAVLGVFEALASNNIVIPTAETGQRTAWHVLSRAPEMPEQYRGAAGRERVKAAVMALERSGRIVREEYRKPDRKTGERWTLPHFPVAEAA